jgi:hypothetical protein
LVALEHVFEGRHATLLASASEDNGIELMVDFGGGVAEVRNAGARDSVNAVAIKAVSIKEDAARVNDGR